MVSSQKFVVSILIKTFFIDFFTIDRQTNFLRNVDEKTFDRESELFVNHLVPQISIKLNLRCDTTTPNDFVSAQSENLISDEIFYSKTVTHLHIVIADENDNSPIFTNPSQSNNNFAIGFPDIDLVEQLKPQNLIQIDAFDLDEGLNAKIKFSLESYEHFTINSETGVVSPLKGCLRGVDKINITVIATDRDGAIDGNESKIILDVFKVREENVVEFNLENANLENVETIIKSLSITSNIDLRLINYFAIPSMSESEGRQITGESKIIVFVYGFDNDSQFLLNSREIINILSDLEVSQAFMFAPFNSSSECNQTGFIVAVSVLGGLLLLLSIAAPLIWFLWIRKAPDSRRSSSNSIKKLEEDSDAQSEQQTSTPPSIELTTENETYQTDADILGIAIDGVTQGKKYFLNILPFTNLKFNFKFAESTSDSSKLSDKLMAYLEAPQIKDNQVDRKKSGVHFNELVERIEVISDDLKENSTPMGEYSRL